MANGRPVPSVMIILPNVELTNLLCTSNFFELFSKMFFARAKFKNRGAK